MKVRLDGGTGEARFVIDEDVVRWSGDGVEPNGDAALTLTLLPALVAGHTELDIDAPVDGALLDRLPELLDQLIAWFVPHREQPLTVTAPRADLFPGPAIDRAGVGFSGGVDSFHSALTRDPAPEELVFVIGFDVRGPAMERLVVPRIQQTADALGRVARVVTTDVLPWAGQHINFGTYHGAALIAAGHLLRDHIDQFVVASTFDDGFTDPWGTHPDLDPMWSSSRTRVEHHGTRTPRTEKLLQIVDHPVVQAHLRVCATNLGGRYNCGRCEKCVRTMIALRVLGSLDRVTTLPDTVTADDVLRIPHLTGTRRVYAEECLRDVRTWGQDPALARALERRMRRPTWRHQARLLQSRLGLGPDRSSDLPKTSAGAPPIKRGERAAGDRVRPL